MEDGAPDGTRDGQPGGEWRAQLPADLKENEAFTSYRSLGDFAKAHLDTLGRAKDLDGKTAKITELEGRLSNSIPKLSDKATDEERAAFYKVLGRPDKPEQYEFPKNDGIEHDPKMIAFAQKAFHKANLSKDQAAIIGGEWDGFLAGLAQADKQARDKAKADAEKTLKTELGSEDKYNEAVALAGRVWKKFSNMDFDTFCNETGIGNDVRLIRFVVNAAKLTGEDTTPQGSARPGGESGKPGLVYDKSPKD